MVRTSRRTATGWSVAAAVAITVALTACVGAPPEVADGDPILTLGRDVYARNCASCHGSSGEGGVGQQLSGGAVVAEYPDVEDQIAVVANGARNMPAYAERLSAEELQAVVRYTREVL